MHRSQRGSSDKNEAHIDREQSRKSRIGRVAEHILSQRQMRDEIVIEQDEVTDKRNEHGQLSGSRVADRAEQSPRHQDPATFKTFLDPCFGWLGAGHGGQLRKLVALMRL